MEGLVRIHGRIDKGTQKVVCDQGLSETTHWEI